MYRPFREVIAGLIYHYKDLASETTLIRVTFVVDSFLNLLQMELPLQGGGGRKHRELSGVSTVRIFGFFERALSSQIFGHEAIEGRQ
jgi:hypothetical protein